ncbi:MAG: glycosyltransferase family 2 protein [Thermoleophilia bacterium]|nr:glycosyltransferase family 2 protein [Thermoleophilia bacterium]
MPCSVVVPVYGNAESVPDLVESLEGIASRWPGMEAVFVIDGSPDDSADRLRQRLAGSAMTWKIVHHSRNFGAFNAIRTGLGEASGRYIGVMAADLQEPPELMHEFFRTLGSGAADVVVGRRSSRDDGRSSDMGSRLFWAGYRRFVQPEIPAGGVDIFGCTAQVRDVLLAMHECNSSLVAQLYWVGFRRAEVPYDRQTRQVGTSGWTLRKKIRYLEDSVFSFTDLPIRALWGVGTFGFLVSVLLAVVILVARITNAITVPGYAATALILLLAVAINCIGLGIIGSYVWRSYENTKRRPLAVISGREAGGARENGEP